METRVLKALAESKAHLELPGAIGGEGVDVRCQELNGVKTAAACLGVVFEGSAPMICIPRREQEEEQDQVGPGVPS